MNQASVKPQQERTDHGQGPGSNTAAPRGHIGRIVVGSLTSGLVAALLLVAAPFIPAEESAVTGAVLCGFALGWAMLAVLSVRFTDQPQRWAAAPALFMGGSGIALMLFGSPVREVLRWVWPPAVLALVIWMFVRSRRQLRSPSKGWLLYPVIVTLFLASVGGGYQTVGAAMEAGTNPMPGQLIDVGGHRLHLRCTGSGSPTVVLEPGGGEMSSNMGWIAPAVARNTRVCVYDRAGRGWSEPADSPQDGIRIATDLHTLLQRGHEPGPFVLAGHSFGALYVLTYAARYPNEVAGMVLLDSTNPASATSSAAASPRDEGSSDILGRASALVSTAAQLGLGRLYGQFDFGSLPPQDQGELRANSATAANLRSTMNEYAHANASMEQAGSLRDFVDKPLFVLTAGIGGDAKHTAAQNHLATLSTNTVHRVIAAASHEDLIADRRGAAVTTQAILAVVSSIRRAGPLAE
ncbi:MAG: alpha/beta hydrolase [Humibacillus sp.]|nr:alpha/beta hydrolase [Humibacillus sp.]MDN5777843.1 alpha/beta hydrolase [Humibacillus sp.]